MAARWAAILLIGVCGCKAPVPKLDPANLHPYRPETAPCGELAGLPGRPLLPVTRLQCLAATFAHGRVNGENFRARVGAYFLEIPSSATADRSVTPTSLEPSMELLRLCEDTSMSVERDYWSLRTAYANYLCKAAAADAARELEEVSEKLVEAKRQTTADLEKARQARIAADMERESALYGTEPPGLIAAEQRLRQTMGYVCEVPGLLLPVDPLPVPDPAFDCDARLEFARDHRLEIVSARYRILAAEGRVVAVEKADEKIVARQKITLAKQNYARWEARTALDIRNAMDKVEAAAKTGALIAERRASVARQLADFEKLAEKDVIHKAELIEARIKVVTATAEEHQAVNTYLSAVSDLDRVTGAILTRDGIKVPSALAAGPPRPRLEPTPGPPPPVALNGPVRPKLEALSTGDPFAPLPAWLEPLTRP